MRDEIQWWMDAGHRDSDMADTLLQKGFFEGAAFHCQQAAEKYLKGALLLLKAAWVKTHSCTAILHELKAKGMSVPAVVMTAARRLDAHYIPSRYPNGVGGAPERFYDRTIADECVEARRLIRGFVDQVTRQAE